MVNVWHCPRLLQRVDIYRLSFKAQGAYSQSGCWWVCGELFHDLTEVFSVSSNCFEGNVLDWNSQNEGLRSLKFVAYVTMQIHFVSIHFVFSLRVKSLWVRITKEQPEEGVCYLTQCWYCSFVLLGEVGGSSLFGCVLLFPSCGWSNFFFFCPSVLQRWGTFVETKPSSSS